MKNKVNRALVAKKNNLLFRHWAGIICLMCAVIFNVQYVAATNVSGTTYASNLVANDNIVLTGNTVLFMNTDLTLTGISGDYTLEIQGSNTLTVNNPNGNAISVSSLNTISASLDITGSKDGLNVDQDITISGGSLVVHAGVDGVYSRNGSITMNGTFNLTSTNGRAIYARIGNVAITGDITASTSSSRMSAIEAGLADNSGFAPGNITITGSTVNVSAVNVAIHAYAGSVSVTGDATVTSSNEVAIQTTSIAGFGETFKSDVTLDGTFHLEGAPYAVVSGGKLMLKTGGSITSVGTLYALEAMTLNGDVDVDGRNAQAICCRWGDISITGNLIAKSASTSEPCVQAGFADNTGFASGGVIIFGGTVNIDAVADAIKTHADGGINISGNVTVKSKKGAALFAMAIDLTNFNDKFYSGDITLAGTINLSGGKYGIVSGGGDITLQSGSLTSVGALYALSDITINGDLNAKTTRPDVPCIQAGNADNTGFYEGNVTITGNNIIVSSVTDAIKSHARGNIRISGNATVYSLKGAAIYAFAIDFFGELYAGNVTLDGTIKLNGGQYGIVSGGGDITLQSGSLTSVGALYAMSDITINGDLNVKTELADRPCIQAGSTTNAGFVIGNITINGETILVNSEHDAIKAIGGNIRLTGNATVASSNGAAVFAFGIEAFGESYKGDVIFGTGEYNISGKEYSIVSHGAITLSSALKIVSPTNGTISGYTIVDSNSETAKFVHISAPAVSGSVALTSEPAPGDYVSFTLTGDVAMTVISQVWQISDDGSVWSDIEEDEPAGAPARDGVRKARKIATDSYYVPKQSEIGKYLRVQVKSEGHIGYLYSPVRRIAKFICTKVPETPTLSISDNKVVVDNAKKIQEYIIFNVQRDPADLVESDWANAVSPASNGSLELTGVQNSLNCVYTRVKETSTTQAGTDVEWAPIYNGTATTLSAIKLSLDDRTQYFDIQGNELNCALGDVIRITAAPVPSNATGWVGVQGSKWLVNGVYSGSPYGTFYANEACTTPLNASSYYSTVYFKTQQQKSCVELRAEVTGASGTIYRAQAINIGDANGDVLLDHVTVAPQTIGSGEYLSGIRFYQYPKSAALENLTAETSGTYRVPLISFNVSTGKMIIDARNADQGDYTYTLKRNGETIPDQFTVSVTKGKYDVDSIRIRTKYITADPGEVVEIIPLLYPASSEAEILWYTTDEVNGPVSNGKVTIANDAPIGTEIFITAIAMGRYDNCKITVSGEEYGLYVASTQVTSRNRDDILGDGKFSFDGLRTLTINGDVTLNTPVRLVQNTGIEDLLINIADTCIVTQQSGVNSVIFDLHKDTRITGKLLSITGNTIAINVTDNSTLTLDNADLYVYAQYPLTGDIGGNDSLSIVASRVEIRAKGSAAVDDFNGGISLTDCYIQTPTGGEIVDATIEDGNGSQVRNLLIVPHREKVTPWMAFFQLEVNATVGEALEEPTLLNPEQLSVTYSSSDPSVATVDALTGDVTLVAAGSTVITATFAGNEEYNEASASYTLTVTPATYTVTWLQDDGTQIDQTVVEYGVVPTHADPSKPATAEYTYTFTGWTPNVVAVTGNATYTATYSSTKNTYTVTWLQDDGTQIDQTVVEYGIVPTHADPSKPATAEYTYTFTGWTPNVVAVTGNATYTATYSSTKNTYTVTWLQDDGTQIDQTVVEYGVVPTHADPSKPATAEYTYTFTGWTPNVVAVTGNATYTATYSSTKNTYTVTWLQDDGTLIDQTVVEYGVVPTHADPSKPATAEYTYTFTGWTPNVVAVTGNATYTATYSSTKNSYTVTFVDYDGTELKVETVEYGQAATPPANPVRENYYFMGWDSDFSFVTEDMTVTATYKLYDPTDVDNISTSKPARKVMIDGQIFILRGDKTYTITGAEVK